MTGRGGPPLGQRGTGAFEKNHLKFFYSDFSSYLCTLKLSLTPMDVAFILDKYFKGKEGVSIDVFDAQTLNAVYQDVVSAMTSHLDIEISVLM